MGCTGLFLGLIIVGIATISHVAADDDRDFKEFLSKYSKEYASDQEEEARRATFMDNAGFIKQHNDNPLRSYDMMMNQFGDMTHDQFRLWVMGNASDQMSGSVTNSSRTDSAYTTITPDQVDWQQIGALSPVLDQGRCRSSWAIATSAAVQSASAISTGELLPLSEQQLIDCSWSFGNDGCNGGSAKSSLDYIIGHGGICTSSSYPYTGRDSESCQDQVCDNLVNIRSYSYVLPNNQTDLKMAVATRPVISSIDAVSDRGIMFYSSGIYDGTCSSSPRHSVLIVGYGVDSSTQSQFWKIQNSWGEDWGQEGFMKLARTDQDQHSGQCAIAANPLYPIPY